MSFENNNTNMNPEEDAVGTPENNTESSENTSEVSIDIGPLFENSAEEKPAEEQIPSESDTTEEIIHSSYEWDSETKPASDISDNVKIPKKKSEGKGFKTFLAVVLSVFTVSIITMTAMVADFIHDNKDTEKITEQVVDSKNGNSVKENTDKKAVNTNPSNYVVFDNSSESGDILSIPQIAAKCSPSSVGIISEVEVSYGSSFFPFSIPQTGLSQAIGSGFIYSADGYVITNHHVIENAKKITVVLYDKTELEAELIGSDSLSDIAVLKIKDTKDVTLVPMEIGNSDEIVVGEAVVAIGCPAGIEFLGTVTDGIVSSINRDVEVSENNISGSKTMTLIQTNATINQGNSGGPLINTKGQVIGINTLKLSANYEGIGFSIPMNGAMPIIRQLMEHGKVIERTEEDFAYGKGIIGINGSAISEDESEYYDIPRGVLVVQINREGSAARAGLRRGDIITHYNGKEVKTVDDINAAKGNARAGESVTVTVYRDGNNGKGESVDITFNLDAQ